MTDRVDDDPQDDSPAPAPAPAPAEAPETQERPLPKWVPGGAGLGKVLRMDDIESRYGKPARTFAQRRLGLGFVLRMFDGAFARPFVDTIQLGDALSRWGRATAWANNALFGERTVPGVEYAAATRSVVIQFTAHPEERRFTEDGRDIAPTAVSARWLAALLKSDEPDILEASSVLRPRATGTYLKALEEVAQLEAGIDWLLLDEAQPRRVAVSPARVLETIAVLDQPVGTRRRRLRVTGVLYAADQYGHTFKMDVIKGELAGRTIAGKYGPSASETLEGAWRRGVDAVISVTEPVKPGLPRAPRTQFELIQVRRIREDLEVPPEPEQLTLISR